MLVIWMEERLDGKAILLFHFVTLLAQFGAVV
jgi:hypothetical protein